MSAPGIHTTRTAVATLVAAACVAGSPAAEPVPRITVAGSLSLPAEAVTADGAAVELAGMSGVTWLGGDRWAAVLDTGAAFVEFRLDLAADGTPLAVRDVRAVTIRGRHDVEDVAPWPAGRPAAGPGPFLAVCEEDTPAIRILAADGAPVGTVRIPDVFATRRANRGLEALCLAADGATLWTANEESLPGDGPAPAPGVGTVVRLAEVRPAAAPHDPPGRQIAYAVDPPHAAVPAAGGDVYSGVVALAALPDGRLLVMERSAVRGLPPFENRIYAVDPRGAPDVADAPGDLASRPNLVVAKRLAWRGALGCNLEGLALGPPLAGGGTGLVGVADAGGLGTPTRLFVLRMDPPVTTP